MIWLGGDEEQLRDQQVIFVAVIKEETDVEKLASKVSQLMKLIESSDTKPDPDDREVN